ncbi:(5-formylfuran-3-yl)methyl phosphate synthase [Streptomyces anulatus]|uniref:(5-formylfuran-3-yl)methyl phosphate synthase n=1 Tax=Streptomyces anulatus TaxID=1892 RepID=UPI00386C102B|nr:(5-formylfuran-3-yl)methyl phosphate synthase [Streptomyces anulatus]
MKVLISPVNVAEAVIAAHGGADIVDIKNIDEGSLGASFPWVIRETIRAVNRPGTVFSATLGDLPHKPGTASLAALGAVVSGASYVKAGLHGSRTVAEGVALMTAVVRACQETRPEVTVVTAGYADHARFGGLTPRMLVTIAADSGSDLVMLDTLIKDGKSLFDALPTDTLGEFVAAAHTAGLKTALAGSVRAEHLPALATTGVDVVGVRGAVCGGNDRSTGIQPEKVAAFMTRARQLSGPNGPAGGGAQLP